MKRQPLANKSIPLAQSAKTPGARLAGLGVILFALVLVAFFPAIGSGFIDYDDPAYVTANDHVQQGLSFRNVAWAFSAGAAYNWHPLTWLSHMLDCQLFGLQPWGHHLTNVLLHATATALLFWVLNAMTRSTGRSFFVAAFFGLHPLRLQSVAWIAERKDVLSGVFFMLVIWTYVRFAKSAVRNHEEKGGLIRAAGWYTLALWMFALGLMCKPMLVSLPFVLLLLDYWPLGRFAPNGAPGTRLGVLTRAGKLVWEKRPFFILAALSCVVTFLVQKRGGAVQSLDCLTPGSRIGNALVSYCRYLGKMVWPAHLAVFYPLPLVWTTSSVILALLLLAGISIYAGIMCRRAPYLIAGWLWFLGTLVPVIGLVQVGGQAMADRYTYLPCIGLLVAAVWGANEIVVSRRRVLFGSKVVQRVSAAPGAPHTGRNASLLMLILGVVLILICVGMTWFQCRYWYNSETLFRHALEVTEGNYEAHNLLGMDLCRQDRLDEGIEHFRQAIRDRPRSPDAYGLLGAAILYKGIPDEAIQLEQQGLRLDPTLPAAHEILGQAYQRKGLLAEAIAEFEHHLETQPKDAKVRNELGSALLAARRVDEAVAQLSQVVALRPDFAGAHNNLGIALCRLGRLEEGIAHFESAIRLDPGLTDAKNNLSVALARMGREEKPK